MLKRLAARVRSLGKKIPKHFTNKKLLTVGGVLVIAFGMGLWAAHSTERTLQLQLTGNKIVPIDQPLTFTFTQDVALGNAKVVISPDTPIDIAWQGGEFGQTILVVTPRQPLQNSQEYTVTVSGLARMLSRRSIPDHTFTFRTELAPGIASFSPTTALATRDVTFALTASDPATATRQYDLKLEPEADLEATFDNNLSWQWKPVKPLRQGTTYTVTITADGTILQKTTLRIAGQPNITVATEKNYFYPGQKITVAFDRPMRTDQPEALFFNLPGKGFWESQTTYVFTPEKLQPGRSYTYNLKAGLASKEGGVLEQDRQFTIATPGATTVTGGSPQGSGISRNTQIRLHFDQPVDKASAQARFSITPAIGGSFRWEGEQTLIYTPQTLAYGTPYTVSLAPGTTAIHGTPGTTTFTMRFTTEVPTVRLNVPVYQQTQKLSCEASALRMALAYRGIQASDMDIVHRMGYNPRPLTNGQWDDPYSQFVGDINGKQWDYTGYGVYAPPVAKASQSYGRAASVHYGVNAAFLAKQIHDGNPVIVWGYQYQPTLFSWTAPGNKTVQAWQGEHTRTVIGVRGMPDNPEGFYVSDPAYGGTSFISAGALIANMNVHGNLSNQAVVVY